MLNQVRAKIAAAIAAQEWAEKFQIALYAIGAVAGGVTAGVSGNWPSQVEPEDLGQMDEGQLDSFLTTCDTALATASWPA